MDLLKQEILKKRQALSEETGGRKVFKRSEIEQKRIQKLREEEKRDAETKRQRLTQSQSNPNPSDPPNSKPDSTKPKPDSASSSKGLIITDEQKIDLLKLPKQEVIRRLRFIKQPVTLFGESDGDRLDRLKYVLKTGLFEVDDGDMTEGQTNDFLRDIVELKKRQRTGMVSENVWGYAAVHGGLEPTGSFLLWLLLIRPTYQFRVSAWNMNIH